MDVVHAVHGRSAGPAPSLRIRHRVPRAPAGPCPAGPRPSPCRARRRCGTRRRRGPARTAASASRSAADLRVGPVQVGLLGREQVQVPLPVRHPGPGRAAEDRRPVVRRLARRPAAAVAEDVAGPLRAARAAASAAANHACWSEVWLGTRSTVTRMPQRVRVGDQRVEVGERAEQRIDVARVGDVVAVVDHRRRVERGDPERVDAEQVQVAQLVADAGQVADAVAVGVGEAAHVDLVEDRRLPPRLRPPAGRGADARLSGERCTGLLGDGVVVPVGRRRARRPAARSGRVCPTGSACCRPPSPGSATASASCSGGSSSESTAVRMCRSQASRSAAPIANGACRIRSRGCPRCSEYVRRTAPVLDQEHAAAAPRPGRGPPPGRAAAAPGRLRRRVEPGDQPAEGLLAAHEVVERGFGLRVGHPTIVPHRPTPLTGPPAPPEDASGGSAPRVQRWASAGSAAEVAG